jgi:hypothetical protein
VETLLGNSKATVLGLYNNTPEKGKAWNTVETFVAGAIAKCRTHDFL